MLEQDPEFDRTIGQLDYVLSKMMLYAKQAEAGDLSVANKQTLKHHAEDMEAAARAIFSKLGITKCQSASH